MLCRRGAEPFVDESRYGLEEWALPRRRPFIPSMLIAEQRGADILQPDLAIAGGLTEGVRIGAIASAYNLRLAPHLWSGAPAFAAGLALAASQSSGFILEYSRGANPMLHELVREKFPVVDGHVEIPDHPSGSPSTRTSSAATPSRDPGSRG